MATLSRTIMSSTRSPTVLMATKVPPSTLAEPGPVHTVVTPARAAIAKVGSAGSMPSMARRWGTTGSLCSL